MNNDGREHSRKSVKTNCLISIDLDGSSGLKNLKTQAELKDISLSGFCLHFKQMPGELNFNPAAAHHLIGRAVSVKFAESHLTVWGEIVRFDARSQEMAVVIAKTSNNGAWQDWCDKLE